MVHVINYCSHYINCKFYKTNPIWVKKKQIDVVWWAGKRAGNIHQLFISQAILLLSQAHHVTRTLLLMNRAIHDYIAGAVSRCDLIGDRLHIAYVDGTACVHVDQ